MEIDRNGLEVLDRDECLQLLRTASFGRVGLSLDALPAILPVNYRLVGEDIVFSSGPGTKLHAAALGSVIAFEVDHVDPMSHRGWSVLVLGIPRQVTDPDETERLSHARIPRWAPEGSASLVVLETVRVSGRRIGVGAHRAQHEVHTSLA